MRRRLTTLIGCLLLLGALPRVWAQDDKAPPVPPDELPLNAPASAEAKEEPDVQVDYGDGAADAGMAQSPGRAVVSNTPGSVNFKGYIRERGTRRNLSDLTIYLKGADYQATTDDQGYFFFQALPPGAYNPIIPTLDYEEFATSETIRPGETIEVVYYLEPRKYGTLEVVVHGRREKKEVSRQVLGMDEAMVLPGAGGDAVRVIENLPGVARGGTFSDGASGGAVIRGSNAEDSRILLDGHEIPMLFHFFGMKSVYNSELLDEVNLYTGGFGSQWGLATGGIVELKSRQPRNDRWGGLVDLSMTDASAMAEGPIAEDMGLALALRRSTMDLILPLVMDSDNISFTTYPVYYDYQAKWNYRLSKEHSLSLDIYGGVDLMKFIHNEVDDDEPEVTGTLGMETQFHSAFLHYRFDNGVIESDFSPGYNFTRDRFDMGDKFYLHTTAHVVDLNEDVRVKVAETNTLGMGFQLQPRVMQMSANIIRPPKEGDVSTSFSNDESYQVSLSESDVIVGLYVNDEMRFGPVTLIPGVRFDYESYLDTYSIGPRATVRYQVVEPLVLKAASGLYSRVPDPDEMIEPFGNGGLRFEKAVHAVGGAEWTVVEGFTVDIQGYYKYLFDMVNALDKTEPDSDKAYANNAKGYVYGGEAFLKYRYEDIFFGWISYSVSRSMRNDGPGTPYRLFDMDQTHNLVVVGSWQFYKGWRLGGRFQFTSGEPYTEILGGALNADNGTYLPIYDPESVNGRRNAPFHKLDLRLDKQWVFDTWILYTYLDVQNVYYHANVIETRYNYDYSEKASVKFVPIYPSFGITAEF
ncbi:MAG: TonB-dependent receptor [Myxococcales bacterium]|nr:MAG: TonB-dependent receptor [Myxococcales bacterium]